MKKKNKIVSGTFEFFKLIPNMMTMGALCLGLYATRLAIIGDFKNACLCVLYACLLDTFDGRVARKLNVSSEFGAQMDSLADFYNFGVAPGFIMYFWKMQQYTTIKGMAWFPVLILAICMAIRLARFNVSLNTNNPNNPLHKYFFQGIPAPMAAMLVFLPLFLSFECQELANSFSPLFIMVNTVIIAILAGSTIPTPCVKKMQLKSCYKQLVLIILAMVIVFLFFKPWLTLSIFLVVYVLSIFVSWIFYAKFKKELTNNK